MNAPLPCRRVVSPEGRGTNLRLDVRDPVAQAVRVATKRWPAPGEAEALWRSLMGAGWRLEDVHAIDKTCLAEGCEAPGCYGFGPIGPAPGRSMALVRWTCAAHRGLGAAHLAAQAGQPVSREPARNMRAPMPDAPAQGSLFG